MPRSRAGGWCDKNNAEIFDVLCSLNEIEVTTRRACRGVELSWGLSYEAGHAMRCLAGAGVEFLPPLLSFLARVDGKKTCSFAPASLRGGEWHTSGKKADGLSPIAAGCGLSDGGSEVCGERVVLHDVLSPVLLLGFLWRGLERWENCVSVRWGGIVVVVESGGFLVAGGDENVDGDVVVEVCEERGEDGGALGGVLYKVGSFVGDIEVAEEDWKILGSYASRIYVAASEESRTRGAG